MANTNNSNNLWQQSIDERTSKLEAAEIDVKVQLAECNSTLKNVDEKLKSLSEGVTNINKTFGPLILEMNKKISEHGQRLNNIEDKEREKKFQIKRWKVAIYGGLISIASSVAVLVFQKFILK